MIENVYICAIRKIVDLIKKNLLSKWNLKIDKNLCRAVLDRLYVDPDWAASN